MIDGQGFVLTVVGSVQENTSDQGSDKEFVQSIIWDQRGDKWLAFAPGTRRGVIVNSGGREVIERLIGYADEKELRPEQLKELPDSLDQYSDFINSINKSGILGACEPNPRKTALDQKAKPLFVYLHVTNACNLKCSYCYNADVREKAHSRSPMKLPEYKVLFRQMRDSGVKHIVFTGGEALVHKHFFELAEEANNLDIPCSVITNGTTITPEIARKMCDKLSLINISIDCIHPEINDRYRGENTFALALKGVEALAAIDKRKIQLKSVITNNNVKYIREYFDFFRNKLGIEKIRFSPVSPISIDQMGDPDQSLSWDNHKLMDKLIAECVGDQVEQLTERCLWSHLCGAASEIVSISPEGDLYPCQSFHVTDMETTNVRDVPFLEAFRKSKLLSHVRNMSVDDVPTCDSCDLRYVCGGGCRSLANLLYGDLLAYNQAICKFYRHEAINLLWYEAQRQQIQGQR